MPTHVAIIVYSGWWARSLARGACADDAFEKMVAMLGPPEQRRALLDGNGARFCISPTIHIQGAEQLAWMKRAHELPVVERFP